MRLALGSFWLFYFAGYGIFFPYFALYLGEQQALGAAKVGVILALIPFVGLVAQPLWGRVADRTGSRRAVLAATVAGAAVMYLIVGLAQGFLLIALATGVLALFATTVVPLGTAVSLAALEEPDAYGRVRLWGSLGFLVTVAFFPLLVPHLPAHPWRGLGWMFPVVAALSLLALPAVAALPRTEGLAVRSPPGDLRRALDHRPVVLVLATVFGAQLCMQGPIHLFPLLVAELGGGADELSRLWILMLALEIPLLAFAGTVLSRLGARGLLVLGLAAEGLRWLVTAFSASWAVVGAAQLLHGVGVVGILVGGPLYLELSTPARLRATGQTLLSTLGGALASILSIAAAGWLFDHAGPRSPFLLGGIGAAVLAVVVAVSLPPPRRPNEGFVYTGVDSGPDGSTTGENGSPEGSGADDG